MIPNRNRRFSRADAVRVTAREKRRDFDEGTAFYQRSPSLFARGGLRDSRASRLRRNRFLPAGLAALARLERRRVSASW
jgi:hypothetical protein